MEQGCKNVNKYTEIVNWNWEELIEFRGASEKALNLFATYHLKVLNDSKFGANLISR